jgi:hypothetical protein
MKIQLRAGKKKILTDTFIAHTHTFNHIKPIEHKIIFGWGYN